MRKFEIEVPVKTILGRKRDIVTVIVTREDIVKFVENSVKHDYFCDACTADENNIVVKFN